jgi:hypothetical protein
MAVCGAEADYGGRTLIRPSVVLIGARSNHIQEERL